MIRQTPSSPTPYPPRWKSQAQIAKEYLDSLSPDELLRVRPHYWALRFGPAAAASPFSKALHPSHYNPDQPRVPAGNPDGGEWTDEGATYDGAGRGEIFDPGPSGVQVVGDGHHYIARGVFQLEKYTFGPETLQVFKDAVTGPLNDPTSNRFDEAHRRYNKGVEDALDRFLEKNKIRSDQMTPDQARSFVQEIKTSRDPSIHQFNRRLWMREIMYWMRRGPRGRE